MGKNNKEDTSHLQDFALDVLNKGVKSTLHNPGSRSCMRYIKNEEKLKIDFIASVPVEEVIDTTSCGDSLA